MDLNIPDVSPILPTTILGAVGLVFYYLYATYKSKNDNELREIQNITSDKRKLEVIQARLNGFGTTIPTKDLDATQSYNLLVKLIRGKTVKYLISAITAIILSIIIAIVLLLNKADKNGVSFKDLNLHYIAKDKVRKNIKIDLNEITLIESETKISADEKILKLSFQFPCELYEKISSFSFYFGEPFSKRLGSDKANPYNWSADYKGDGEYVYTPGEMDKDLEFQVFYK